jgi:hypothetical protein
MDLLFARIFAEAEVRFGPRTQGWTIAPIVPDRDSYPETIADRETRTVTIHIMKSTLQFPSQAMYQLAHESIHCLIASGRRDTLYFEEGLAVDFSVTYPGLQGEYRREAENSLFHLFQAPLEAFRALNAKDAAIKALRGELPNLDGLLPTQIQTHFEVSESLATAVCLRLPSERPEKM